MEMRKKDRKQDANLPMLRVKPHYKNGYLQKRA